MVLQVLAIVSLGSERIGYHKEKVCAITAYLSERSCRKCALRGLLIGSEDWRKQITMCPFLCFMHAY